MDQFRKGTSSNSDIHKFLSVISALKNSKNTLKVLQTTPFLTPIGMGKMHSSCFFFLNKHLIGYIKVGAVDSNQSTDNFLFFFRFKVLVSSTITSNFTERWESLKAEFAQNVVTEELCPIFRISTPFNLKIQNYRDYFYLILNY